MPIAPEKEQLHLVLSIPSLYHSTSMQTPQEHFSQLELIFHKHAQALEAEVRALQVTDETSQWPTAWKKIYNWKFAQCFARQRIFRNWAADCAAWKLLPERDYPNRGNCRGEVADE